MKKYLSFFRIRFIAGLQYRAAAWAGHRHPVCLGRHDDPYVLGLLSKRRKQFPDDLPAAVKLHMDAAGVSCHVYGMVF